MPKSQFQPGFRISFVDAIVLVAGTVATIALWQTHWWLAFVIAFVVGHFFLFCNVFRVARPLELAWATVFVASMYPTIAFGVPGWPASIAISLTLTVAVIMMEMRKPSYHGVLWRRLNPGLPQWWEAQHSAECPRIS